MGLDMFLTKKYYIGAQYDWNNVTGNVEIFMNGHKLNVKLADIESIDCEKVYWRKANMIHKWFVDHVQEGTDDCKTHYVSLEHLRELLKTCILVRDDNELAKTLLPTQDGFFFGDIQYNEEYFKNVEYTIKELGKLNLMGEDFGYEYYYQSSW